MKSVLFINRVYPPDDGATGQLLAELAAALAHAGWKVTVLASGTGDREQGGNLPNIRRVRGLPFTRASMIRRALSYASLYPALLWRALALPRHDVVVTLTDPPLLLVLGPLLKWIKRSRLIHWAQDVYPEVAEELGVLPRRGLAAGILRMVSTWSLHRHHHVVVVGRCMKARLLARGLAAGNLTVVPNWAVGLASSALPGSQERTVRSSNLAAASRSTLSPAPAALHSGSAAFVVMYSGNFGLAHPFESIIEAVKILEREGAAARFVFAGTGPKFSAVREALDGCRIAEFRGHAPLPELAASLASADAHLACMMEDLCGLVVPSKVYGVLAAGRPCLFLGPAESEAAQWIRNQRCGLVLPTGQSGRALADAILLWSQRGEDYQRARRQSELLAAQAGCVPVQEFLTVLQGPQPV